MEIDNGTTTLHVEIGGTDDAPPILFLHGITQSVATWAFSSERLAARFRVVRLDFRGHGQSDRAPGHYLYEHYLSDAVAVCEQVIGKPCGVIGHSLGGATAASLAQHRPDLVQAALLEDPPMARQGELLETSLLETFALLREAVPQMQDAGMHKAALVAMLGQTPNDSGGTMAEDLHEDALDAMCEALLQLDTSVLDGVLDETLMQSLPFDSTQPVDVPLWLVGADAASPDAALRTIDRERVAAANPLAHVTTIAGAGHLIHDSRRSREAFSAIVDEFVATLG